MTIYDRLDSLRSLIALGDWDGLEAKTRAECARLTQATADRIAAISLFDYETDLRASLASVAGAERSDSKAIYWEFNPDHGWHSSFFRCRSYQPEAVGDDEWAADFDDADVLAGPAAPDLAAEFATDWDRHQQSMARNVYLIARTVAGLGRASSTWESALPLCAGYHDQDILYRVRGA
jgi:hypothetical protein